MADYEKKVALIEIEVDNKAANSAVKDFTASIIDQQAAIKANNDRVKDLNKSNKELEKEVKKGSISQDEASKATKRNNEQIVKAQKENFALKDDLKDLNKQRAKAVEATKLQSNSLDALRKKVIDQKKELNGLNTATEKGKKRFDELTKELDKNNEAIRSADKSAGDFKTSVGNYTEGMEGALSGTDNLTGGLASASSGFLSMAKSAMAFIATPIGAVIAALVGAFLLVKNAMDRSEDSTNKIKKALAPLTGVLSGILKALEPVGEFLIEGIVKGFELAAEAAESAMALISDGLKYLGFDEAAKSVENFTEKIKEAVVASVELAEAEAQLQKAQRESSRIQLEFQKQAEKLRQIRDDESISIAERIKANEALSRVLARQLKEEMRIRKAALDTANLRIKLDGESSANLDLRAEALTEIADLEERITGQESEQLTNRNALLKEQAEKENERWEAKLARREEEKAMREEDAEEELLRKEEEAAAFEQSMADNIARIQEHNDAVQAEADKAADNLVKKEQEKQKKLGKVAQLGQRFMTAIFDASNSFVENRFRKRFEAIEKDHANGAISDELYARKKEQLEKSQAMSLYKIQRKQFIMNKAITLVQIAIDTAMGIMKTIGQMGFPAAIPFVAAIGATGLASGIAAGMKKPPPPPQFADGGDVFGFRSTGADHSAGGETWTNGNGGSFNVQGREHIFVTKRDNPAVELLNEGQMAVNGRSLFDSSVRYAEEGGAMDRSNQTENLSASIVAAMELMPVPVLPIESVMGGINAENEAKKVGIV